MAKIFGAIMIFLSCTFWGFSSSLVPYKRYKNLIKIMSALNTMKNEIRFSSDYIDEIILKAVKISEFDYIFQTTAEYEKSIPISKRWKDAVLEDYQKLHLNKEDCEALIMFGSELGMTDREGQLKNIENTLAMLATLKESAKEDYEKMSKLKKGLGLSLGLFTIIILF